MNKYFIFIYLFVSFSEIFAASVETVTADISMFRKPQKPQKEYFWTPWNPNYQIKSK